MIERPSTARYVWWIVYSTVAPLTLQQFRDLDFQFSRKVLGLKEKTPRWKGCTGNVNADFGMALSFMYVRRHFDEESREKVRISSIRGNIRLAPPNFSRFSTRFSSSLALFIAGDFLRAERKGACISGLRIRGCGERGRLALPRLSKI
jgi:hypothetical protein